MMNKIPAVIDLVLVGGGHSHALFLKMWAMNPVAGVRVLLISDVTHTPYSGMLPAHIGGVYSFDESHIDLRSLAMYAGAEIVVAEVRGIDPQKKAVHLVNRPDIRYDYLSINIGSSPDFSNVSGKSKNIIPIKPVTKFLNKWEEIKEFVKTGEVKSLGVIGAGAGGVELCLWMRAVLGSKIEIHLVQKADKILPGHNSQVRKILIKLLKSKKIHIHVSETMIDCDDVKLICKSGLEIKVDRIIGVTNAKAPEWPREAGLDTNEKGFINVKSTLQSTSHESIFAAGDIAHIFEHPRAKTGVFAVRMAKPLYDNIKRSILGQQLSNYTPQKYYLNLIGTGDGKAVASRRFLASHGQIWWKLKDSIDRKFMNKLNNLGPMADSDVIPDIKLDEARVLNEKQALKCLGCGAKVGGSVLSRSLGRIKKEEVEPEIEGIVTDWRTLEDGAVFSVQGKSIVSSIDYFPALFDDPYLLGRVATLHAFSDSFAMGADPHSCLLQAQVPMMKDELMEETLYQMVKGVFYEINKMPARLLGGHTTEGILGIGLQVNGTLTDIYNKKGMCEGDKLVLTKPLGIGILFAAQMQAKTKGRWIDDAIATMLSSNQTASRLAIKHGVSAMTDVTGFGLLGHLHEMLVPGSKLDVKVNLDSLPILDGAIQMSEAKIKSSLFDQNKMLSYESLKGKTTGSLALLGHDPQTSGGLLCFVKQENESAFLSDLKASGYHSAETIGSVVRGTNQIELL